MRMKYNWHWLNSQTERLLSFIMIVDVNREKKNIMPAWNQSPEDGSRADFRNIVDIKDKQKYPFSSPGI
jgi:hypothetical protein